jgi:hypothetical protein
LTYQEETDSWRLAKVTIVNGDLERQAFLGPKVGILYRHFGIAVSGCD